jgi:hypothetical protein
MSGNNFTSIKNLVEKPKTVSSHIEGEPIPISTERASFKEVVEHESGAEVSPHIIKTHESIKLPDDLKQFGLESVDSTKFPTYQNIKLPLSDEKIVYGMKAPPSSSMRWLAVLATYMLAMKHLILKVVKGKIIRVIKK